MLGRYTLKAYYHLTKPGIIYGNAITAVGGFLLASKGHVDVWLLLAALAGISLVIASACVVNNYIDRDIDKKMARTKKRALASGTVSARSALVYAVVLGVVGFTVLALWVNALTVVLGIIALVDYVVLYGLAKRHSVHGTAVGTIAGALPVTAGYVAVTGAFDLGALLLFIILVIWQMPHFYAIAIFRQKDYEAASIPVWPIKMGVASTKLQMMLYVGAFMVATSLLTVAGFTGYTYLAGMLLVSGWWLAKGLQGYKTQDDVRWARGMFFFSLKVLLVFSALISLETWLP